jgi:hypothetical protein
VGCGRAGQASQVPSFRAELAVYVFTQMALLGPKQPKNFSQAVMLLFVFEKRRFEDCLSSSCPG